MGGKSGGGGEQIVGYRYSLSIHMGIGRGPIDQFVEIRAGDLPFFTGEPTDNGSFTINNPNLFGGDQSEGGIVGNIYFMMGASTQSVPGYIQDIMGAPLPGFRGVTTVFYDGQIGSNNPYPKAWKFRIRRAVKGWEDDTPFYPEKATITLAGASATNTTSDQTILAMNPSHIIYECATNSGWGRGLSPTLIDADSFQKAADTLFDEGFGICMLWTRTQDLDQFVQQIIDHIGAALYVDRNTGLLTLKLIRADYNVDEIPAFDYTSGLLDVTDDTANSTDTNYNEVVVTWHNPIDDQDAQVRVQNLASIQSLGGTIISTATSYPGIPTSALALRLAQRDVQLQSETLRKFTVKLDRSGWNIPPGGVFKISIPSHGLSNIVLRAGEIDDSPVNDGTMTIKAVQDVFGLPATSYISSQAPTWTPPDKSAHAVDTVVVTEMTYWDFAHSFTPSDLASVQDAPDSGAIKVLARKPTDLSTGFELETAADTEALADRGLRPFMPNATLVTDIGYYDTDIHIENESLISLFTVGGYALIDDEYVRVDALNIDLHTATIARGCIDSIPAPHAEGAEVWFSPGLPVTDGREYSGETIHTKLLTKTNTQTLAEADADTIDLDVVGRQGRPYLPGKFTINTIAFGDLGETLLDGVDIELQFAHRNRITQGDALIEHVADSTTVEDGVTYTTRVYSGVDDTLLRTTTGIADDNWTYTTDMIADDLAPARIRVELEAVRDTYVSFFHYNVQVIRLLPGSGFDGDFDYNFDGGT